MKPTRPRPDPLPFPVLQRVADALRVLAHPRRLQIVERLAAQKLAVGQLAARLDLSHAACSQHLSRMRAQGLLRARREGKTVYYEVCDPNAINVIQCIRRHAR